MVRTRGGHTDPSASREARPMPSSPPQRRYSTWRPLTSPPPKPSVRRIPPKRARTSSPGETSSYATTARPLRFIWIAPDVPSSASITPREFFYPKVAMDFYQPMATQGVRSILEDRHIVEALHIPFQPEDPEQFRQWSTISQRNMVRILSRGTSRDTCAT
ncbi:hypothetical protein AAG906_006858 [Vitis piasezkii]